MNPAFLEAGRRPRPLRITLTAVGIATVLATTSRAVRAQPLTVDPAFAPLLITRNVDIEGVTLQPLNSGGFLAHGNFSFAGTTPVPGIAQLNADGATAPSFAFAGPTVRADDHVLPLADGRVIVVRSLYDSVAITGNARFERYLADGSIDPAFATFTIPAGYVRLARPTTAGRFILAGYFPTIAGEAREGLARLNADGTLDASYAPTLLGPNTVITHAVVDAGGNVTANGYAASPAPSADFIGRFSSDGSRDTGFNPVIPSGISASALPLLAAMPDGRLILGSRPASRLNADGTVDATFVPAVPEGQSITNVIPVDNDHLLVGTQVTGNEQPPISRVFMMAGNGTRLFDYSTLFPGASAMQLRTLLPDGSALIVHGNLLVVQIIASQPADLIRPTVVPSIVRSIANARVSRVAIDGRVLNTFAPPLGLPGSVQQIVASADGGVLISGDFDLVDDTAQPGLARLLADGTPDPAFVLPDTGGGRISLSLAQSDGRLLVRMPEPITGLVRRQIIQRLLADGSIDASLPADSDLARSSAQLYDVDATTGRIWGNVLSFSNPILPSESLVVFTADGAIAATLPTQFSEPYLFYGYPASFSFYSPFVYGVRALPDGDVLVAGNFSRANDTRVPGIVRLNPDGSVDPGFTPMLESQLLFTVPQLLRHGHALVSTYTWVRGQRTVRTLRLLPDGSVDPGFRPQLGGFVGNFIGYADEQADGSLISLGEHLSRWSPAGDRDLNFAVDVSAGSLPAPPFYSGFVRDLDSRADGRVYVGGRFAAINGIAHGSLARLVPAPQPGITVQPMSQSAVNGSDVTLQVAVGDAGALTYQWQFNGVDLPGATGAVLRLANVTPAQAGPYRAVIRVGNLVYVSESVTVGVTPNTARLTNFSARSRVHRDAPPQIAGFVTQNGTPRQVLIRAIGRGLPWDTPLLALPRPSLGLFSGAGELIRNEGGARDPLVEEVARRVGAFVPRLWILPPLLPNNSDAGMVYDLPGGLFTAQTTSADGGAGVSLFEFYDAALNPTPGFVQNVSLRGHTDRDQDTMIGGLVVAGEGPLTLLIRAVGSELGRWDVPGFLHDPQLRLFAGAQELAFNDDWNAYETDELAALMLASETTGAFPLEDESLSAALLVRLEAGAYTVHASGGPPRAAGPGAATRGEVLLEIYVVEE